MTGIKENIKREVVTNQCKYDEQRVVATSCGESLGDDEVLV